MIITKNAYYLHIPKTAGTWLSTVLSPISTFQEIHLIPQDGFNHSNVYSFVRNPWSWYVSLYTYLMNGTETGMVADYIRNPFLIGIEGSITFEKFLYSCCEPSRTSKFHALKNHEILLEENLKKNKCLNIDQEIKNNYRTIIYNKWLDNDISFYEQVASVYLKFCTKVGKYENLKNDLLIMLKESNELTEEVLSFIENRPKMNVTLNQNDYRSYYTTKTIDLVEQTSKFLNDYKYNFE